ncbi:MAG: gluconate 2-dehydrogenase subunit 3 family protein [Solitalea sp.]
MDRRESLKVLTLGSLTAGAVLAGCEPKADQKGAHGGHDHKAVDGDPQRPANEKERDARLLKEKFFTDHEMATITVLANLIIPADDRSGNAEEAGVPEFIEFTVKDQPNHQTPIRGGLRWLDVECLNRFGKSFKDCAQNQQTEILDEIAWPEIAKPEMQRGVTFFNHFRNLVASGFWTSKIGIEDIGYQGNTATVWDGVPQDVLDELGVSYDPNIRYVTLEDRQTPMNFDEA